MRFAVARSEGLTEEQVDEIDDGYDESTLPPRYVAALRLTDAIIGDPLSLSEKAKTELRSQFTDPELVELGLGVSLFISMSRVLITLGLEPEQMETTVIPTPGMAEPAMSARRGN